MALSEHLEKALVFQKIISCGSLRKASKELRISQPALTRTLSILERETNAALVIRTREGLKLTPQGHKFLDYCRSLQKLTDEIQGSFFEKEEKYEATLQMGTYESIAIYLFPYFLRYLSERQKRLRVSLKTSSSASLMEDLKMSRLDMIVSVNPKTHKSVVSKVLYEDRFEFYSKTPTLDLKSLSLIGVKKAADAHERNTESYIGEFKLTHFNWIDCQSFETVKALCAEGLGVGILPTRVAAPLVKQKLLSPVKLPRCPASFGPHTVEYSFLKSRETDPAIKWLFSEMKTFLVT